MGLQTKAAYGALESDGVTPVQHPVELDRNFMEGLAGRSGAFRLGDFALAPTGTNQQLSIASGVMFVNGQENAQQGGYTAWSDASETKNFGAPSGSPRIDTLLMRIYDSQYGTLPSGTYRAQWDVVAGTPGATPAARPDSDFLSGGSQYVPGAWIKWAEVRINPGDTTIPSGQIFQPGTVVSGTGTTWRGVYNRQAGTPYAGYSTTNPVGLRAGELFWEVNTNRMFYFNGSVFKWNEPRGVIGGTTFSSVSHTWNGITTTEAVLTSVNGDMVTGSIALEANRRYRITAKLYGITNVSGGSLVTRIRETNVAGAIVAEDTRVLSNVGVTFTLEGRLETSGAVSKTYCVSASVTGGTGTAPSGTSSDQTWIEVEDIGPAGVMSSSSAP